MSPVERALQPGEAVRFERHPLGWPPLTSRVVVLYSAFLALAAIPVLGGVLLQWTRGKLTLPVPIMVPALAAIAVFEAVRFAAFRSRLYVVTTSRVLVLGGIVRTRLRGQLDRARIRGLQLVGGEPAVLLEERKLVLSGLDAADLDSLRALLGDPPVLPPVQLRRRRRWRRPLAFLVLLLVAAFLELEGWVQRTGAREFQVTAQKVGSAVAAAEAAISTQVAIETGEAVARRLGQSENSNLLVDQTRYHAWVSTGHGHGVVSVETRCERIRNVIPLRTSVTVIPDAGGPENKRFLEELRLELTKEGVEATWPR